jgi:hypothetical protein
MLLDCRTSKGGRLGRRAPGVTNALCSVQRRMSASGPKRTSLIAPHMSAFGGKADMAFCGISVSRSLLGVKRTCLFALHMSAFDPKRTCQAHRSMGSLPTGPCPEVSSNPVETVKLYLFKPFDGQARGNVLFFERFY